ncbi:unnamed protein product [Urochloa decumbens]|uniref:Uncharacterized protein n=1 Tax=Urochloa decumbens TaxID=240449 RepID=A0ABC8VX35_9POAL
MVRGLSLGGALRRAPAGPSSAAAAAGGDENAPRDGPSTAHSATSSRPPLRSIQPRPASAAAGSRKPQWLAPTPSMGPGVRAAGKMLARRSASLAPMQSLRKPASRLGMASSVDVPTFKVREAISFWEVNRNVQKHASEKIEGCSNEGNEGSVRNTEDVLSLQLELDVLKTIFVEEVKAHAEVEERTAALGVELKAANFHILEACRQKEATEKELDLERRKVQSLELDLTEKLNELEKNNFQSPVCHKKMDMETPRLNSALDTHCCNEYVPYEDPKMQNLKCLDNKDSPLGTKLKKMQASLEKARNLNTRYQQAEHEKEEILREAEIATTEVILSLKEQLSSVQLQLNASKRNELLATQNLDEIRRIEFTLDESIEAFVQKEVLEQSYVALLRGMEEEICKLKSQLNQSEIKMQELEVEASASLASWNREREIAEQRKAYVEEKNEEIKLLELSREDLEDTVRELEKKMHIMNEEAKHQRRQQEKIEAELQNVKQQLEAVPSSGEAGSFLDDGIVDLADSIRHQNDMNSELLGAQGRRIFQGEVSIEPAPQVEHFLDEYMADQSDVDMEKAQSSDMDYLSDNSKFEHPTVSDELGQISTSKQPELFGSVANSYRSLPAFDSEKVQPPDVEQVIEVLEENELPPVAPVRLHDPVNYMRAPSDELKRIRSRNHYEGHRTATDRRFWSIEQQDLYTSIYSTAKLFDMKWTDWEHIDSIEQFACVREQCANLGLEQIMSYRCDWDSELIRQFYATVHISADKSSLTWMADGRRITTNKRAWEERFGIPGGVHTEIHSQFLLDDHDKRILYTAAECTLGKTSGLSPLASIANKIMRTTIYPKSGNTLHAHNWNLLYHIVEQQPFDIIALIFGEMELLISDRNRTKDLLLYAPYIMGMIMRAFEYDGPRKCKHHSYKPRHSYQPKQTKKGSRPPTPAAAVPFEQPSSQPEVEVHVEADDHRRFKAAGHQPQGDAVQGQAALAQDSAHIDLFQVVEDMIRPRRDSLATMEGRVLRTQHANTSSSQIPAPRASLAPSLQAATPAPPSAPASSEKKASRMHGDCSGASAQPALTSPFTQPALVRPSPFSGFRWYQKER